MALGISRRFNEEILSILGKMVVVETNDGNLYQGKLLGVNERLDMIIGSPSGMEEKVFKLILNGDFVKDVKLVEKPFDLRALADRLSRVFPGLVKLREDVGAIIVMDKIKVTEQGVEGVGLAADRVRSVFEEFARETKK